MRYMFDLQRNIFMYNHLLTVSDGKKEYKAIIESIPTKQESMAIWLEDFNFPKEIIDEVKEDMMKWFTSLNIMCVFNDGKGR